MDDRSVFHLISDLTKQEGVPCVLIGGFAINYYRVSRNTGDIDFLITREDFEKIVSQLEKAGYKKSQLVENFAQLESGKLSLLNVDFMFVDKATFTKIFSEGQQMTIAKQVFTVPSLEHLIALKLHALKNNYKGRLTKDLPDIVNLVRINDVNFGDKKFKDMCFKYGTVEIYDRLMEVLS